MGSPAETDIPKLIAIAYRMALRWSRSPADAEDISQEAMIRFVAATPVPENPVAWLHVVVRRLSNRSRLRNLARRDAEAEFIASSLPGGSDIETLLELRLVMSRMGDRHQRVISLLVGGAQSHEIAEAFGVKVRDVGQMVSRARKVALRTRNGGTHKRHKT
jgi:DNA-directed RNA polymerase specialized sigma24 family protein